MVVALYRRVASLLLTGVSCTFGVSSASAQCVLPYALANGTVADAPQMMANFNALVTCLMPGGATNTIQTNGGPGPAVGIGPLTDGQLAIGSTGAAAQAQALTAGTNVAVTNGAGSITVTATNASPSTGLYRQVLSPTPTVAGTGLSTWVNQGTSVGGDSPVGVFVDAPANAGVANLAGRSLPAPTPPYTVTALITGTRSSNDYSLVGLGWYNGSDRIHVMDYGSYGGGVGFLEITQWNSPTSYRSTPLVLPVNNFAQPIWVQIKDDGTNVSFAFSQDGANFLPITSVAKASGWLGATGYSNIFFFVNPRGNSRAIGTILSWTVN